MNPRSSEDSATVCKRGAKLPSSKSRFLARALALIICAVAGAFIVVVFSLYPRRRIANYTLEWFVLRAAIGVVCGLVLGIIGILRVDRPYADEIDDSRE